MKEVYKCEVCGYKSEYVRFEGSFEGFICDECLGLDHKDLLEMALNRIYDINKKTSVKQLKADYEGYFDNINEFKTKLHLLNAIMEEEFNYKSDYSKEELLQFLKNLEGGLK